MATHGKRTRDRTSIVLAVVFHAALIGGVVFWAYKSGKLEQMRQAVLQYVRSEKKQPREPSKPVQQKPAPAKLPPINQGLPQTASSGTRRAVAVDAPAAPGGESFFQDTRAQGDGPSKPATAQKMEEPKKSALPPSAARPAQTPRTTLRSSGPSNVKALFQERSKAAASIESFGSEQISKSSVSDAGDIVSRVSGASVVEGKYAVIRGLTDRYSAATLNGVELPSADPYRRSAGLDMFPAKIIDRVMVTKTFTADQPGSFTGGNINIITRSFPDRPFASVEVSGAYNTQTTGNKDFLTYSGGSTDWLGMDDGTRALPEEFWDPNLVLGTAFNRINTSNPRQAEQLPLTLELDRQTRLAGEAEFAPSRKAPPPAHNFVASGGDTLFLFGRPLGIFFSLPYARSYSYYAKGKVERAFYQNDADELEIRKEFTEQKGVTEVNWAGTASVAYQIFPDHQMGYNFIYNQFSEDSARIRRGSDTYNDHTELNLYRLQFIERNLTSHQFRGDHLFPDLANLKMDWMATFTDTSQDEPDTRFYHVNGIEWGLSGLDPKLPTRFWRQLEEQNENYRADFTLPFLVSAAKEAQFKFGAFQSHAERNYRERILQYDVPGDRPERFPLDPNQLLVPGGLGIPGPLSTNYVNPRVTWINFPWTNYLQVPSDRSFYTGESEIPALYAMLDVPVFEKLRLIGGARFEKTDIRTVSFTTVPSEGVAPGETNSPPPLEQEDILPSMGLVWSLRPEMNLRLNYGETVTRPSFRELAGIRTYDPVLDEFIVGNPNLKMSAIQNYDARWEWFPRPGELFSVGLFYKHLEDVIEKRFLSGVGDIVTFENIPEARVYGMELEARKGLDFLSYHLRHWSLGGNLSLIESEQKYTQRDRDNYTGPGELPETRSMADQSAYIANVDLTYDNPGWGTTLSLNYSIFGPRLIIASTASPDIYEQSVPQLDLILSQRIGRNLRVKLTARNLLNPLIERTYGEDPQAIYQSYTRGQTYSISLNYEF